jgi:hypothetical protein
MSGLPQLRIKHYFGLSKLQEMTLSLEEARGYLANYWSDQTGFGVKVYIEGKVINSYDELVQSISQEGHKGAGTVEVGIYQTTNGKD